MFQNKIIFLIHTLRCSLTNQNTVLFLYIHAITHEQILPEFNIKNITGKIVINTCNKYF